MSATNRTSGQRNISDLYETPPWVVDRFLDYFEQEGNDLLPGGRWLEPGAGSGAIIRAVNNRRNDVRWSAVEILPELEKDLRPVCEDVYIGDFLGMSVDRFGGEQFKVALGNPPYSLAWDFVQRSMRLAEQTAVLLRLNFWESAERREFLAEYPPDTFVLPQRPCFALNKHGKPGSDATAYAWFLFQSYDYYDLNRPTAGHIRVLGETPALERKAWLDHLREEGRRLGLSLSESSSPSSAAVDP